MHGLMTQLTDDEKAMVGNELDKLYSFQDRQLPKEKKAFIVQEIAVQGFPFKAIIAGIRSLFSEDLKSVKLATLSKAIRENINAPEEEEKSKDCVHCSGVGSVTLCDEEKRGYALACTCTAGRKHQRLVRWNGEFVQLSNGRTLEVPARFRVYN